MKVEWDYTELANAYLKRPDYAEAAIDRMLTIADVKEGAAVCDVGAGAAHLTLILAKKGFQVKAVEPNDAMRANGIKKTEAYRNVEWFDGVGEHTGQPGDAFQLVTFGSSFNVTNRQEALEEANRLLVRGGWFACMWNHRDLEDPFQKEIEEIIKRYVADYQYGTRREDQTKVIEKSGLFTKIQPFEGSVVHQVPAADVIEGWRSHGTVHRQAKECFDQIMRDIEKAVRAYGKDEIAIPYTTRGWMAQTIK